MKKQGQRGAMVANGHPGAVPRPSARPMQVLVGLSNGETVQDIAARLDLKPSTVHGYRFRLMRDFRVASDVQLVREAVRLGILAPTQDPMRRAR